MRNLRDHVVVITGASSGLGRAAAIEFARRGCRLVLGARRADALADTARACRDAGADNTLVVPTDVTIEDDVQNLAARALSEFGGIDVWVNNAGVTAFAALEDGSFEIHRRVIETNLFGAMYGARAVLPIFKRQATGTLINVGSTLSTVAQPYVPSYVVSKFGLRGLTEVLRTELADHPNIQACTLLPYAFDSPHFETGANRLGLDAHPMPPQQSPEKVARALVSLAESPRHELHVPRYARLGVILHALMPKTVERATLHLVRKWHFGSASERTTSGNLFAARGDTGSVHGRRAARTSLPRLLAWAVAHFARSPKRKHALRPHAEAAPDERGARINAAHSSSPGANRFR